jgi:hypothetical protein
MALMFYKATTKGTSSSEEESSQPPLVEDVTNEYTSKINGRLFNKRRDESNEEVEQAIMKGSRSWRAFEFL